MVNIFCTKWRRAESLAAAPSHCQGAATAAKLSASTRTQDLRDGPKAMQQYRKFWSDVAQFLKQTCPGGRSNYRMHFGLPPGVSSLTERKQE
jgi:hypothetical protein